MTLYKSNTFFLMALFISCIAFNYINGGKIYYIAILFLSFLVIRYFFKESIKKSFFKNDFFILVMITNVYICMYLLNRENIITFFKFYLIMSLTVLFSFFSFYKYGEEGLVKIYKAFMWILNIFALLNIYQIVFKRPILINYLNLLENSYSYNFGTSLYRTFSVFGHPIIAGIFFSILFFLNHYFLKSPIKFLIQFIVLINIYSTMSRSSWIGFVFGMIVFISIRFSSLKNETNILEKRWPYKRVAHFLVSILLIGIVLLVSSQYFDDFFIQILERFGDSISRNSTDYSNLQRTGTINLIVQTMLKSDFLTLIFGNGFNTSNSFMLANPIYINDFSSTDNTYLSILFEYGLIGILSVAYIFVRLIYKLFTVKRRSPVHEVAIICVIVIAISAFFFEIPGWPTVSFFLFFCLSALFYPFQMEHYELDETILTGGKL